ncbi:adhesive domain-containing protein [Lederbergia lenta]|uniref:Lpxtg-motif cell wall anchor domain-containing protein n=1 Tax=Lederbergia lenta TaxID=1467 RepID=A0A2X4WHX8_LEDLE|nr:adhesive domain-containing protein [Lederbergia lenta]MEC2323115.1 SpaA isopeptide-forming pilin-related protein [Lederbergia lenta]SQI62751.1 lpxtg-motif cell wall anchor domain-containing protein [Lederbergia lenta]
MKKTFLVILVFLLTFQGILPAVGATINTDKDLFHIDVEPNASSEQAIINISAMNDSIESMEVALPKESNFSKEILVSETIELKYDGNSHKVTIKRLDDQTNLTAKIVLTNLTETNILQVQGIVKGEETSREEFQFNIPQVTATKETDQQAEEKQARDEELGNEENSSESRSDSLSKSESEETLIEDIEEEETKANKEVKTSIHTAQLITPYSGNLNVDIDITPQNNIVLSGNAAGYNLVLKVTGSRTEYTNARVVVDLPITDFTSFTQDVSELIIDGVTPIYNESTKQLIYEFDSIRSGRSYETLIKVNTENGISPQGAELTAQASFEANNQPKITEDAVVKIDASSSISVSKKFKETRLSGKVQKAPFPGSYTIWDIKVSIPKKDIGQMYLKEGSKIVIKDTFSNGLTFYDVMDDTPTPTLSGRTLTWEFDAPTLAEQMQADGEFFIVDLRVRLQVTNNNTLVGTTQENSVNVSGTFIDNKTITADAKDSIYISSKPEDTGEVKGNVYIPSFIGPSNNNGEFGDNDIKDPNPAVYDDAYLGFRHGINSLQAGKVHDFTAYATIIRIDQNLIFQVLRTPGDWRYMPTTAFNVTPPIPLEREPEFKIVAKVNGAERTLVENAKSAATYTRENLGLSPSDQVSEIKFDFTYAPAGLSAGSWAQYFFNVKPGTIGQVENTFNIFGKDYEGKAFSYENSDDHARVASPRHATIVPRPVDQPPIGKVGVELLAHDGGEITHGENRVKVTLSNMGSSVLTMSGPLEAVILMPSGVTLNQNPNAEYTNTDGAPSNGQYEILDMDYNGSGRQLVKINWDDDRIRIGKDLTAELDITVSKGAPNTLQFDVYGFSGDEVLGAPTTSGGTVTDTILQQDSEDLNRNGNTEQPRLKSGNIYMIRGQYDIQTEKLVKGELDDDFTHFGHTTPGGSIEYLMKLTNTTGVDITKMVLIDVLPSVGDLGITDNVDRGSKFTPKMTNSIVLPEEWKNKVNVLYSTAKNPKRDDLTKNTSYPDSTTKLINPAGAENPNWMTEDEVIDWSAIHSFKIELKEGIEWVKGHDMQIQFRMQAPSEFEVDREVLDAAIEKTERAAWNSFAVATDHGQPVEPLRVGVYMDYEIEDPTVDKTINDQKETVELANRNEHFTWKVAYDFGNYTTNWQSVVLSDQIHELLDIESVQVIDQDGQDVTANGELDQTDNLVKFTLNQKNGSFAYLKDQTYTLVIDSKIKSTATDEELEPFIQSDGIPNKGLLSIDDKPTESNEVKVKPPVLGDVKIIKVDEDTGEVLQGAEFELRKCSAADSVAEECQVVKSGITGATGELAFNELEKGHYKLIETKAPDGYRLLTNPKDIEITDSNRVIELKIENKKSGWELPNTGGIGAFIFYLVGGLLMAGSLLYLLKRKKVNN